MATQNFVKAVFQRLNIEVAGVMNGDRFVIERNVRNHLRVHPHLLLRVRKRNRFVRLPARNGDRLGGGRNDISPRRIFSKRERRASGGWEDIRSSGLRLTGYWAGLDLSK